MMLIKTIFVHLAKRSMLSFILSFVDSMLFFRSLEDRTYLVLKNDNEVLSDIIIKKDKVYDFERFLNDANIDCKLEVINAIDGQKLAIRMGDKLLEFHKVISTGTSSLTLFITTSCPN